MTELNDLIQAAHKIVFLTGAGVSTASGIPDYRSKNGLYSAGKQPEYLLSHTCLVREPDVFYQYVTNNLYYPDAQPNVIHQKMAALVNQGKATIITQNIDGLHVKAGAQESKVVEFHGNLYHVYCQKCHQNVPYQEYLKDLHHQGCGGELRCDVVLYEEGIDQNNVEQSIQALQNADLIVIVGTSFVVYPFAGLIQYRNPKAKIVAVNREPISLPAGSLMIQGDAVQAFEQVDI
ncbi:NAD-dependent protein deacylase [Ligilactobacillus ceti]|uniref:protein acetyllysine N-acetyltransferase n=1 Tax=Ligilactobacillus ceti DSM 22408 TaxID=1122146 RepID=A0A0R2KJ52_9LACO|nr:NAD-dependent protein deacylase [Ligilactobacillus ceti]KRN89395.1 Sir2 family transcriptional regulator [Ligilactobacillus ceti DSM 22408]